MPKFSANNDEKISNYAKAHWDKPLHSCPEPKFTKGKKAKSYIENARGIFMLAIDELIAHGFPLKIPLTPENERLHTGKFWGDLGVDCTIWVSDSGQKMATLDIADESGSVPSYITAEVVHRATIKYHRDRCQEARKKISELTRLYKDQMIALIGQAGVYEYTEPGFKFINFASRPYDIHDSKPVLTVDKDMTSEKHYTDVNFRPYVQRY